MSNIRFLPFIRHTNKGGDFHWAINQITEEENDTVKDGLGDY